jgi:hypothetical protein
MASSSPVDSKIGGSVTATLVSDTSFKYSPLNGSEIRIVALHPGTGSDQISCVIQNIDLNLSPKYRALSYTWGDPTPTHEILLNGQPFIVTDNLHSTFMHLRNSDQVIPMWIDTIFLYSNRHRTECC